MTPTGKKYHLLRSLALVTGLLLGQAQLATADTSADEVNQVMTQASEALQAARAMGNAWNITDKLLAAAQESLAAGDIDNAHNIAAQALLTATAAQEQAEAEKTAWQARVPTQ